MLMSIRPESRYERHVIASSSNVTELSFVKLCSGEVIIVILRFFLSHAPLVDKRKLLETLSGLKGLSTLI